ncbi:pro-MCH [Salarias fasciatus]|uniref:Pro-MCH 1-like n=1 Tax=Salarias fasciatus TaxID=181472 RepID=A0A672J6K0_SALFA|nr:pro-MCH 1-like [Salarias fasciatus]
MISVYVVLFALPLLFGLSSHSAVAAQMDDGLSEEDGLIPRDEPVIEPPLVPPPPPYRRSLVRGDDGNPKIVMVSDTRLKGHSLRGPNPGFSRTLPQRLDQSLSHTAPEYSLKIDQRDTDLDMLRCMIGRVYRPCWEA